MWFFLFILPLFTIFFNNILGNLQVLSLLTGKQMGTYELLIELVLLKVKRKKKNIYMCYRKNT